MWSAIVTAASTIFGGWVKVKVSKQDADAAYNMKLASGEQDWDTTAQNNAKTSIKDELLLVIWYSPMVIGWFEQINYINTVTGIPESYWRFIGAKEWVAFMDTMPYWWWFGAFGILSATYGLRWYFKQQNFKLPNSENK